MLLGALMKQRRELGLAEATLMSPFHGQSIARILKTMSGFRQPRWMPVSNSYRNSSSHSCTIFALIEPHILQIEEEIKTLRREDLRPKGSTKGSVALGHL